MEKEKCKNITTIKKITSGVTAMVAMAAGIIMMPFIANASSENIQNSFGGGYKDTADEYVVDTYGNDNEISEQADDTGGVYDFKDNKTTGTVTVTKVWDDGLTNDEREIPDIKISTKKPSKSTIGYTVTFHGNGMKFADGSEENMVVYNSAGEIVQGEYKMTVGDNVAWYSDRTGKGKIDFSSDGNLILPITEDVDLWAKETTFEIKGYKGSPTYKNGFNQSIPSTVTEVIFTDKIKPAAAEVIDVDADGDGGVVAWTENNGTIMKVSTQIKGVKVQAAVNSHDMFYDKSKIKNIDLKMLDTSKVTIIGSMFERCSGLTSLNLTPLDTSNVTNIGAMFEGCSGLTSLDLTPLNTSNVTNMYGMFKGCSGLTSLDLTPLDTSKVTYMVAMFDDCRGLTSLDLTPLNTSNVANMDSMFSCCKGLTRLDLTPLDTSNVANMEEMFAGCSGLINVDLTGWNTLNVTDMNFMFYGCSGLTNLDLTPLNTSSVTRMDSMFRDCSGLTSLDIAPLDTSKVTSMDSMFSGCSGLTNLDIAPLDTSKVTNMNSMFCACSGLTSLDLTLLNTSKVTNMNDMFFKCSGLTSLDLTGWNTSKVTNMNLMFYDCRRLTSLDLTSLDTSNVTNMNGIFFDCRGLTSITTGPKFKFVGTGYSLSGTWQNTAGETFNGNSGTANFPSNVADTYTKIS